MVLFISDLHLGEERPDITTTLLALLRNQARHCDGLYILGDMFEAWVGDDVLDDARAAAEYLPVVEALRELTAAGIPVCVMHGNRDFLLGDDFARRTGCTLLPDPVVVDLYGTPTLLSHGDLLCTDDTDYQDFRRQVRDPDWQRAMLQQPLTRRLEMARQYREDSRRLSRDKPEQIMDVNQQAVERMMTEHAVWRLIHGHTHRPAVHEFPLHGKTAQRLVLDAWYEGGSYLQCDENGCGSHPLASAS